MQIDANVLVTFTIQTGADTLSLEPAGGTISGPLSSLTLIELEIPQSEDVEFEAGTTANIIIEIEAQEGRSTAFTTVAISTEATPFTVFES